MKRYLAFSGRDYYPREAFGDFIGDFDSLIDAIGSAEEKFRTNGPHYVWAIIVDQELQLQIEAMRDAAAGEFLGWSGWGKIGDNSQ